MGTSWEAQASSSGFEVNMSEEMRDCLMSLGLLTEDVAPKGAKTGQCSLIGLTFFQKLREKADEAGVDALSSELDLINLLDAFVPLDSICSYLVDCLEADPNGADAVRIANVLAANIDTTVTEVT